MTKAQHLRRLGQRTWFGTVRAYMDAARGELSFAGRRMLYQKVRELLARYEANDARHEGLGGRSNNNHQRSNGHPTGQSR